MPSKSNPSARAPAAVGQTIKAGIDSGLAGQRLDKALVELLGASIPALSRARVQALLKAGHVTLAGKIGVGCQPQGEGRARRIPFICRRPRRPSLKPKISTLKSFTRIRM